MRGNLHTNLHTPCLLCFKGHFSWHSSSACQLFCPQYGSERHRQVSKERLCGFFDSQELSRPMDCPCAVQIVNSQEIYALELNQNFFVPINLCAAAKNHFMVMRKLKYVSIYDITNIYVGITVPWYHTHLSLSALCYMLFVKYRLTEYTVVDTFSMLRTPPYDSLICGTAVNILITYMCPTPRYP